LRNRPHRFGRRDIFEIDRNVFLLHRHDGHGNRDEWAYLGVDGVDPELVDAARGMGMSERDVLLRVELPLAVPALFAGVRTAALIVVSTTTIGALAGFSGSRGRGSTPTASLYRRTTDEQPRRVATGRPALPTSPPATQGRGQIGPNADRRHGIAPQIAW